MLAFLFALYILGFALSVFGIVLDIRERELYSLPNKPFKEILFETFLFRNSVITLHHLDLISPFAILVLCPCSHTVDIWFQPEPPACIFMT